MACYESELTDHLEPQQNAQTSVNRQAVVGSLLAAPTLRHLAWHAACVLATATALESRNNVWRGATGGLLQCGHPNKHGEH